MKKRTFVQDSLGLVSWASADGRDKFSERREETGCYSFEPNPRTIAQLYSGKQSGLMRGRQLNGMVVRIQEGPSTGRFVLGLGQASESQCSLPIGPAGSR